jgi:hypothetical protein
MKSAGYTRKPRERRAEPGSAPWKREPSAILNAFIFPLARSPERIHILNMFETDRVVEVAARRMVRIAFGTVLIVGAAALVANDLRGQPVQPALLVPLTWAGAFIAGAWVRMFGARPVPIEQARARLDASIVLPSIGIALMLPLTLHLPVVLALGGVADYAAWVKLSIVLTGLTHVVVATMVGIRGAQLAAGRQPFSITAIYLTAIGVSCVPFALLLFIPPLIVAVTGLAYLPLLVYQRDLVERERAELPDVFLPHARLVA